MINGVFNVFRIYIIQILKNERDYVRFYYGEGDQTLFRINEVNRMISSIELHMFKKKSITN